MEKIDNNTMQSSNKQGWLIASLGWITMVLGLFLAIVIGHFSKQEGLSVRIIQSITTFVIIAPLAYIIMKRYKLQDSLLPFNRRAPLYFLCGALLPVALCSFGVWLAIQMGWITDLKWNFSFDMIIIIAVQSLIALGYEAIPEELTLRGLVFSGLRRHWSAFLATITQLILFILMPMTVNVLLYLVGLPIGPSGIPYYLLLFFFALALQLLRIITGSLWASIGFHLAYLLTNRYVFSYEDRLLYFTEEVPGVTGVIVTMGIVVLGSCIVLGIIQTWRFFRNQKINKGNATVQG
ncbi:CAAX amino terminal protease self- immunity [compost metagenome]